MRIWIVNPPAMVNMYFPTAENKPIPDVATVLVMSPKTPSGAKRIMILVIFIITSKDAEKKFRKKMVSKIYHNITDFLRISSYFHTKCPNFILDRIAYFGY